MIGRGEVQYTAFTGKAGRYQTTARLLVRRVRRLNDAHVPEGQGELFTVWRFHAVFTDQVLPRVEAEADHRRHAVFTEQVFADLEDSALGRLPSGKFTANAARLTLAALAHNLAALAHSATEGAAPQAAPLTYVMGRRGAIALLGGGCPRPRWCPWIPSSRHPHRPPSPLPPPRHRPPPSTPTAAVHFAPCGGSSAATWG
ncbi:hypothetical protein [Peterkaempfera sp. SMS 1(5)a]